MLGEGIRVDFDVLKFFFSFEGKSGLLDLTLFTSNLIQDLKVYRGLEFPSHEFIVLG